MAVQVKVKIDLGPLKKFSAYVDQDLRANANGPIRAALKQWAVRYKAFIRERFDIYSKGGGDWAPLAPSTIAGRRRGKGSKKFKKGTVAILRDTGLLFAALDPVSTDKPGALTEDVPFGIRVGFGGPHRYPDGGPSIADVASFHQRGNPWLPKREILVPPDAATMEKMTQDMQRAVDKLLKDTGNQ